MKEVKRGKVKGREGKRLREIRWEEKERGGTNGGIGRKKITSFSDLCNQGGSFPHRDKDRIKTKIPPTYKLPIRLKSTDGFDQE